MASNFQINKNLISLKVNYFLRSSGCAAVIPFMSTISKQRGYSAVVVGWILTLLPIPSSLIQPVIGAVTDKYKCRKSALVCSILIMNLALCVLIFLPGTAIKEELQGAELVSSPQFWLFTVAMIILKTGYYVRNLLDDTICIDVLDENQYKFGYQRLWGAIGWGTMSIISGMCIDWYSKGEDDKNYLPAYIIALVSFSLNLYVVMKIKVTKDVSTTVEVITDVKKVFTEIKVLVFLLWIVAFGIFSNFIWHYAFWYLEDISNFYHPETKPWLKTIQGLSVTIQCFGGELPFFFLSSFILKRMDYMNAFSLMFFTFAVRFFLYSIIENPIWVLPVEFLNGITFALAYSAAILYAAQLAPPGAEGTLQGLVGLTYNGIGASLGGLFGGYTFKQFGSIGSFKMFGYFALITCVVQIIINQLINRLYKYRNNQ